MIIFSKIMPHPLLSLVLLILWLWLNNTIDPGHIVLGAFLGLTIPPFTRRFWPERLVVRRPLKLVTYLALITYDIVVANLEVARVILAGRRALQPGFVRVPLELNTDFAITVFASTISLTPGTVSVEVAPDHRALFLHFLSARDPEVLVAMVKARYETRVREIFE